MPALDPVTRDSYRALADWLARRRASGDRVIGIHGAQGSGKSTLAAFLVDALAAHHGLRVLAVSLDDFYLGRAERQRLAEAVHPLLITRGVPGTHDVSRGLGCLRALRAGEPCRLPAFDKARDDRLGADHARRIDEPVDLVLFEGWCAGTPPQSDAALREPVNDLERLEDPDGRWRRWVNAQLAGPYAEWFAELDQLVHLQVPGWEQVRAWRTQQERETARASGSTTALATADALARFLAHYQRLSHHAADVLPARADRTIALDRDHRARLVEPPS